MPPRTKPRLQKAAPLHHLRTKQHNTEKEACNKSKSTHRTKCGEEDDPLNPSIRKLKASGAKKPASKPKIQPGQLIRGLQPSETTGDCAQSRSTINLNNSYEALCINPSTPFEHTSAEVRTVHVLQTPIYKDRDSRLVDVALEITTHRNLCRQRYDAYRSTMSTIAMIFTSFSRSGLRPMKWLAPRSNTGLSQSIRCPKHSTKTSREIRKTRSRSSSYLHLFVHPIGYAVEV
jgi:hypothetical protein